MRTRGKYHKAQVPKREHSTDGWMERSLSSGNKQTPSSTCRPAHLVAALFLAAALLLAAAALLLATALPTRVAAAGAAVAADHGDAAAAPTAATAAGAAAAAAAHPVASAAVAAVAAATATTTATTTATAAATTAATAAATTTSTTTAAHGVSRADSGEVRRETQEGREVECQLLLEGTLIYQLWGQERNTHDPFPVAIWLRSHGRTSSYSN